MVRHLNKRFQCPGQIRSQGIIRKRQKKGKITVVGYLGLGLGGLIIWIGFSTIGGAADGGQGGFMTAIVGAGVMIGSYLWARR